MAVRSIVHSTGSIAAASRQIAAGSMDLHDRTEKQAAALEQTAASVEQITATAKQSADHVREVSALAGQSAQLARQGSEETQHAIDAMREISQSSQRIDEIIRLIDEIAFQTNILALNAAVERRARASRAGASPWWRAKCGRWRSARPPRGRNQGPDRGVLRFGGARQPARGTGQRHHGQRAGIGPQQRAADGRDRHGPAEQLGIEQINQAVTHLDSVTQQNASLVEEFAAGRATLHDQADDLARAVSVFKLSAAY